MQYWKALKKKMSSPSVGEKASAEHEKKIQNIREGHNERMEAIKREEEKLRQEFPSRVETPEQGESEESSNVQQQQQQQPQSERKTFDTEQREKQGETQRNSSGGGVGGGGEDWQQQQQQQQSQQSENEPDEGLENLITQLQQESGGEQLSRQSGTEQQSRQAGHRQEEGLENLISQQRQQQEGARTQTQQFQGEPEQQQSQSQHPSQHEQHHGKARQRPTKSHQEKNEKSSSTTQGHIQMEKEGKGSLHQQERDVQQNLPELEEQGKTQSGRPGKPEGTQSTWGQEQQETVQSGESQDLESLLGQQQGEQQQRSGEQFSQQGEQQQRSGQQFSQQGQQNEPSMQQQNLQRGQKRPDEEDSSTFVQNQFGVDSQEQSDEPNPKDFERKMKESSNRQKQQQEEEPEVKTGSTGSETQKEPTSKEGLFGTGQRLSTNDQPLKHSQQENTKTAKFPQQGEQNLKAENLQERFGVQPQQEESSSKSGLKSGDQRESSTKGALEQSRSKEASNQFGSKQQQELGSKQQQELGSKQQQELGSKQQQELGSKQQQQGSKQQQSQSGRRIPHVPTFTLNDNKTQMPIYGLGTYKMQPGEHTEHIVKCALQMGYTHIDTAQYYHNEEDVGKAIRECGISREEIFVTSKMPTREKSKGDPRQHAISCVDESLKRMGLDYIDLYLLHSPHHPNERLARWQGLEQCVKDGKVKAIGVSNFSIKHLKELLKEEIKPACNQIEINPFLTREDLRHFCEENNIKIVAYSPLAKGRRFGEETLKNIADKHKISQAQVMIRWCLQHNMACIMKSDSEDRLFDNAKALDDKCKLSSEEMQELDELDEHYVTEWDPISEVTE